MDRVDQVRVRTGRIDAERPQILSPEYFSRLLLEGFGEKAQQYVERLRERARQIAVLRYGFQFRKSAVAEETVSASLQSVIERTRRRVESGADPRASPPVQRPGGLARFPPAPFPSPRRCSRSPQEI